MPHPNGLLTHEELHSVPENDVVRRRDQLYAGTPSDWRVLLAQLLRDELARRQQENTMSTMLVLTRQMRNLTGVIVFLTIANVAGVLILL